nr:DUF1153 domain-containing protein [Burkholderia plantarii]
MSTKMDEDIKRWTAKRKSALVTDIVQGKTTVAEANRTYDRSPSEVENWVDVDDDKRGMKNALRANPLDVKSNTSGRSRSCKRLTKPCWSCAPKKIAVPAGRGRELIETIHQGLKEEGVVVSISQLCRWFDVPRRTVYYRPVKAHPVVQARFSEPIKAMIEESPSFGYRTVAHLLASTRTPCNACSS